MSDPLAPRGLTQPPRRPRWRWLLVAPALAHPSAQIAARWDWRADFLSHLQLPALVVTVVVIAALVRRDRRLASVLAVLAAVQAWPFVRCYLPNPVPPASEARDRIRVLSSNVLVMNGRYDRLIDLIRREDPDVVGLVEYTRDWLSGLTPIRGEYPYRFEYPAGPDGLALYSKRPLIAPRLERPDPLGQPALSAQMEFGGRRLTLWLVHPTSPIRRLGSREGFPELDALAAHIGDRPGPRLVFGDLNTTDGSPHFGDFLARTGLRDSRLGFGTQPSWPVSCPYRLTIDHAFLSEDLAVADRRLGPSIGSDHLPFVLDVTPSRAAAPTSAATASQPVP